ncbi:MAG: DUF2242 domain-containing protein [Rhodocyclaceae bacterium]|nr:DUF2242 domain-containing protein [Rhodocyclaceae bacterium]
MICPSVRLVPLALFLAAGCSTHKPEVFSTEAFDPTSPFERRFKGNSGTVCEAARRALLSQGYLPGPSGERQVTAAKSFQPSEQEHMTIEFTVACIDAGDGGATAYANAVQTRFELRTTPNAFGLSAPIIGALTLPLGTRAESLVKTGAMTISDPAFYDRFWILMAVHAEPELQDSEALSARH